MAFALHSRLTFSGEFGALGAAFETWSCRFNLSGVQQGGTIEEGLVAARTAWTTHLGPRIGNACRLTEVKHAFIGTDGLYTGAPSILAANVAGGATSAMIYPPQIAVAVSLLTDQRGPRRRGRFYLPNPVQGVGATGLLLASDAQSYATSAAAFLGAINIIPSMGSVVIASSFGFNTPVTNVRVGRALDTMRSRRRNLVESYGAALGVSQAAA